MLLATSVFSLLRQVCGKKGLLVWVSSLTTHSIQSFKRTSSGRPESGLNALPACSQPNNGELTSACQRKTTQCLSGDPRASATLNCTPRCGVLFLPASPPPLNRKSCALIPPLLTPAIGGKRSRRAKHGDFEQSAEIQRENRPAQPEAGGGDGGV